MFPRNSIFNRELQREKVWSRIHLVPLLLAEGDRDVYRRQQAALVREKEIMKDVPGWEVSVCVNANRTNADTFVMIFSLSLCSLRVCVLCVIGILVTFNYSGCWSNTV